jgi:hypothetical protein
MARRKKVYDASNPEDIEDAKQMTDDDAASLRYVMASPLGRKFLYGLIHGVCHMHGNMFTGNSGTFFNEGARQVGVRLMQDVIALDRNMYLTMLKENLDE